MRLLDRHPRRRLVQQQELRPCLQRQDDFQPLLLGMRQLQRRETQVPVQTQVADKGGHVPVGRAAARNGEVLCDREVPVDVCRLELLGTEPDAASMVTCLFGESRPIAIP